MDACDRLLSEGKLPMEKRERVLKNKNFAFDELEETTVPRIFHFIYFTKPDNPSASLRFFFVTSTGDSVRPAGEQGLYCQGVL